ncbi:hypothetical protein EB118_14165 [bacterium]|nr:hypothetical protein [bacterium]NDD85897.1 hypothetical protein [bacterium]NDG31201.1 hypothetical protein [bacterium]
MFICVVDSYPKKNLRFALHSTNRRLHRVRFTQPQFTHMLHILHILHTTHSTQYKPKVPPIYNLVEILSSMSLFSFDNNPMSPEVAIRTFISPFLMTYFLNSDFDSSMSFM